jgi:hypothetical protein
VLFQLLHHGFCEATDVWGDSAFRVGDRANEFLLRDVSLPSGLPPDHQTSRCDGYLQDENLLNFVPPSRPLSAIGKFVSKNTKNDLSGKTVDLVGLHR